MNAQELRCWLLARVAAATGIPEDELDDDQAFSAYGLESPEAVTIAAELADVLAKPVDATALYAYPTIGTLADALAGRKSAPGTKPFSIAPAEGRSPGPQAIVGMACRAPGAHGPEAFWSMLLEGVDAVGEIPRDRWDPDQYWSPNRSEAGTTISKWAGLLDDIEGFDASFFGISPAEAERMDPQQRLLLETIWEALEDAGLPPADLRGSQTGVFVGISVSEYGQRQHMDAALIDGLMPTGSALSIAANRVSYLYDWHGPSVAVDTACSSSLVALHLAARALRGGDCELAVVAGVNVLLDPELTIGISKAGMLSPDGRCKVFDAAANGYVRSEGCGAVVLRPMSSAEQNADRIYAVLRGSAVNSDGHSNGLTAPNPIAQEAVLRSAYQDAAVDPRRVCYVECHGTGTLLGDPIEAKALGPVVRSADAASPCLVGSVKSNIGHLESAAGIAGVIKTALALHHGTIPPSIHFRRPNPHIPFAELGLQVATEPVALPGDTAPWLAGVSSFGFGGTNAHAVLESVPRLSVAASPAVQPAQPMLLPLSAASARALHVHCRSWLDRLDRGALPDLAAAATTAALRRQHHRFRVAFCVSSASDLREQLTAAAAREPGELAPSPSAEPRVAFAFSGQGTQWAGMGTELMAADPLFASFVERCDEICLELAGWSVSESLTDSDGSRLSATERAQPILFAIQAGLTELWRALGIHPVAVVGHSSGEIAAAYAAGFLSLDDAMRLAIERGAAMAATAGSGKMLAIGMAEPDVRELLESTGWAVEVAAVNAPDQVVLSGAAAQMEGLRAELSPETFTRWLAGDYPFHSSLMESAAQALAGQLNWLSLHDGDVPFYSAVTGDIEEGSRLGPQYWQRNVRQAVRFADAVAAMVSAQPLAAIVEIGPQPALHRPLRTVCAAVGQPGIRVLASSNRNAERTTMLSSLAELFPLGAKINWRRLYRGRAPHTPLPLYPWQHQRFWLDRPSQQIAAADRRAHPLLGQKLRLAGQLIWQHSSRSRGCSWLAEHRVAGHPLMPAAGYSEMMLAAASQAGLGARLALSDLALRRPMPLDEADQVIQTTLNRDGNGFSATVHSGSDVNDSSWHKHATARVRALGQPQSDDVAWPEADYDHRLDTAELYDRLARRGLDYGPAFRGLTDIRAGAGKATASIEIPGGPDPRFRCDPRILDGALQLLAAVGDESGQETAGTVLPARIRELRWYATPGPICTARLRLGRAAAGQLTADIQISRPDGGTLVEIDGLALAEVADPQRRPDRGAVAAEQSVWYYEPVWRERELTATGTATQGTWLVFHGTAADPVARAIATALRSDGSQVIMATGGPDAATAEQDDLIIDTLSPDGFSRLLIQAGPLTGVIFICGPADTSYAAESADSLTGALVQLIKALAYSSAGTEELVVISQGAHAVGHESGAFSPAGAAVWGAMRCVPFENPVLRHRCIDLDPGASNQAELIAAEIRASDEIQVAIRHGQRFVRRLAPVADVQAGPPQLAADGWYLVTGGLGGLGLSLASWLAEQGAAKLALVGRGAPSHQAAERISEIQRSGVVVVTGQADVGDQNAMAALLDELRGRLGPLRGVIHAAGVLNDGALLEMEPRAIAEVMRPKTYGVQNLHRLTLPDQLDWFVAFSSAASVVGSPGQANYCAANAFLDTFVQYQRANGIAASSINWGPWADAGMAAQSVANPSQSRRDRSLSTTVSTITIADGLHTLGGVIASGRTQLVAMPHDLRDLLQFYPAGSGFTFFEEVSGADVTILRNVGTQAGPSPRPDVGHEYVAARNPVEQRIVGIWQASLGMEPIGVFDGFFELGGDSVFGNQIILQVNRLLNVAIEPEDAFDDFTIAHLAEVAERQMLHRVASLTDAEAAALLQDLPDVPP